jgi:hypothetical protein
MIPKFFTENNEDRIKFVKFIQNNKDIFDELLSEKCIKENKLKKSFPRSDEKHTCEGYWFFRNFPLGDDADVSSLTYDLDDFNHSGQTDIHILIHAFQRWLTVSEIQKLFNQKFNEKILGEIKEKRDKMKSKRRTIERTSQIKEELADIDYVPEDRQNSVKGKAYRSTRDSFNERNRIGGKKNKTKKYKKSRRVSRKRSMSRRGKL